MKTEIEGLDEWNRDIDSLMRAAREEVSQEVVDSTNELYNLAMQRVPIVTGALAQSMFKSTKAISNTGMSGYVGSKMFYAMHVEFGTQHAAPRPFLFPAAEQVRSRMFQRLLAIANKHLGQASAGGAGE